MALDIIARGMANTANTRIDGITTTGAPYVGGNGNWYTWNSTTNQYEDSGEQATGATGATGDTGPKGDQGISGTTVHSELTNLNYENSGHIGFQPTLTAGDNITISANNVIDSVVGAIPLVGTVDNPIDLNTIIDSNIYVVSGNYSNGPDVILGCSPKSFLIQVEGVLGTIYGMIYDKVVSQVGRCYDITFKRQGLLPAGTTTWTWTNWETTSELSYQQVQAGTNITFTANPDIRNSIIINAASGITGDTGPTGPTGPTGATGDTGLTGADGFSPTITVDTSTDESYILSITDVGGSYNTPNLKGTSTTVSNASYGYENYFNLDITKYTNLLSGTAVATATSVYWPFVIKVSDKIENPLGTYYMYYSSDHAGTTGYISMAYSDSLTEGWTNYGQVYRNPNGSGYYETETPSVIWNKENEEFIMYFQSSGSSSGEAQSSWILKSADGIAWTGLTKMFDIDGERIQGNLHNGYVLPFNYMGMYFAYSLMGGGNGGAALNWSEDGGYTWMTDHRRLGRWGLPNNSNNFLYPNHGTPVMINGQVYFLGIWSNFSSGTSTKIAKIALAPMSDLRNICGKPQVLIEPTIAPYEDNNLRTISVYVENGKLYVYYNCSPTGASYINVAVIEAPLTSENEPILHFDVQPISQSFREGSVSGTLSVNASISTGNTLDYQWYANTVSSYTGTLMSGETNKDLTIPNMLTAGTYYYYCKANSAVDNKNKYSDIATITITEHIVPTISFITQPISTEVDEGLITGSLTVLAETNDSSSIAYQWYKDGTIISGETNTSLTIPTDLTEGVYSFYNIATSATAGTAQSNSASVTVNAAGAPIITIVTEPQNTIVTKGTITENLSISATVSDGSTPTYEWSYVDPSSVVHIPTIHNTESVLIDTDLDTGSYVYTCIVSAVGATNVSRSATVTVTEGTVYLAYYNLVGDPSSDVPATISDTSGNNNAALTVENISTYDIDGNIVLAGNASGTSSTGNRLSIIGLTLPTKYKIHTKWNKISTGYIANSYSHRFLYSPTMDYNSMVGSNSAGGLSGEGYKIETSVDTAINATFPCGNFATARRNNLASLEINLTVDSTTENIDYEIIGNGDTVTGTQNTPGFTASIMNLLCIGNNNNYNRAPNAKITELWIEEVQ
jgi:hypothetical protein